MANERQDGVPALRNDDVTGMTEERQEQVIERSGRAPRERAAEKFYDEQEEQAKEATTAGDRERAREDSNLRPTA